MRQIGAADTLKDLRAENHARGLTRATRPFAPPVRAILCHAPHQARRSAPASPTRGPDHGRGPFKCSIHPEWLRRLETLFASAQSDIAQDCIVKAFQLMPRTQLLPPIGKDLVQPTPMRALNVMSADVHGCLQFPNNPIGSLLDPREVGCDHQHNFDVSSWVRPVTTTRSAGRCRGHARRVYQPAGDRKTSRCEREIVSSFTRPSFCHRLIRQKSETVRHSLG